ncbi:MULTISPECIES: hypothetical protein [Clostridia]|uniref:Uncharacterized protein n=1 Tax=Enterocloster citroniae TaxID=358743 RepID=A0AA41FJW4_9FIRM|nr:MULTISPECIES: hypothetical protein [Clostridia]MBS1485022.1 hypothetical protein [Clostridium sp.]MBT9812991.1 hypothetical protein [Enterocloster citroniae]MCB7063322.1 hypothetical protein [Enterocloster citroniae]MCC8082973.1 hypothetical protein [Clostridium sp.]MCD8277951.1 hypothetical protein [Enterocloster citroniae]
MKLLTIHWSEENAFGPPLKWLAGGIFAQCAAMVHSGNKTESSLQYR